MLACAFDRPVRVTVAVLWLAGAALAAVTTPLAALRLGAGRGVVFALVTAGLVLLAVGTLRGVRWVLVLDLILLGPQAIGAVGAALELAFGVAAAKAADLRTVGYDPRVSVAINFVYSTVAFGVFVWAVVRLMRCRGPAG
jgi:hypothetical protein